MSAAQAQSAVTSPIEIGRAKKVSDEGLPTTKGCAKNDSKEVSDISAANAMSGVSGMGAGTYANAQKKAHSINHSIDIDDDTNNDATGLDFGLGHLQRGIRQTKMALQWLNYRRKRKTESNRQYKSLNAACRKRSI